MEGVSLETPCHVCGQGSHRTGLHYGSVTCYPCRAFFRRVPERKRPPLCKRGGSCPVDATVTKHCPGCRFQKCISVGMQLSQVLNEEQRRERFASSLQRKRTFDQEDFQEEEEPALWPLDMTSPGSPSNRYSRISSDMEPQEADLLPKVEPCDLSPEDPLADSAGQISSPSPPPQHFHPPNLAQFLMEESRKQRPVSPPHQDQWEQKASTSNPLTSTSSPWACPQMASVSMPSVSWPGMPPFVSMPSVSMPPVSMPSALNLFLARMAGARQHPLPQVPDYSRHYPLYRPHPPPAQQLQFSTSSNMRPPMFPHHLQLTQLGYDIKRERNRHPISLPPNMYPPSSVSYQPSTNPYQQAPDAYQSVPTPLPLPVERSWTGAPMHHHEEKLKLERVPDTVQYQRASVIQNTRSVIQNYPTTKNASTSPVPTSACTVLASSLCEVETVEANKPYDEVPTCTPHDSELIAKYVHKKFGNLHSNRGLNYTSSSIPATVETTSHRSSVIMTSTCALALTPPDDFNLSYSSDEDLKKDVTVLDEACASGEYTEIFPLVEYEEVNLTENGFTQSDIQSICLTYLIEEAPYMDDIRNSFYQAWHNINLGQTVMQSYIDFSKYKNGLPLGYLEMCSKQITERYMSATCTFDMINHLQKESVMRVMRERIMYAKLLPYIFAFNLKSSEEQLEFMLANEDRKQWQAREGSIVAISSQAMMERMPCSDTVKQTILSQMNDHNSPVLTDKTVHMIMVALVLFDNQDSDIEVRKVHKTTCTMLQGYLNSHSSQPEQDFQTVLKCVKALPTISKTRNQMMAEVAARLYAKKPRLREETN